MIDATGSERTREGGTERSATNDHFITRSSGCSGD